MGFKNNIKIKSDGTLWEKEEVLTSMVMALNYFSSEMWINEFGELSGFYHEDIRLPVKHYGDVFSFKQFCIQRGFVVGKERYRVGMAFYKGMAYALVMGSTDDWLSGIFRNEDFGETLKRETYPVDFVEHHVVFLRDMGSEVKEKFERDLLGELD